MIGDSGLFGLDTPESLATESQPQTGKPTALETWKDAQFS